MSKFSTRQRLKSFSYAFNGLRILIKEEYNARIHITIAIIIIILSWLLALSIIEWIAIIFSIGFVIFAELVNSSIENLADFICDIKNSKIKRIKDLSAAAVLISAFTAFVVGIIIFLPKILSFLKEV